jgi:hypothetical protein
MTTTNDSTAGKTDARNPIKFDRILTPEEVETGEKNNQHQGVNRRLMLVALSKDSDELFKCAEGNDGKEAVMTMLESIQAYREHLDVLTEFATVAENRLLAICQSALNEMEVQP